MNLAVALVVIAEIRAEPCPDAEAGTWRDACDHVVRALILTRPNGERAYWMSTYRELLLEAETCLTRARRHVGSANGKIRKSGRGGEA